MFCTKCGLCLPNVARFCPRCGTAVTPPPAPQPVQTPIYQQPPVFKPPVYQQPMYRQPVYQQPPAQPVMTVPIQPPMPPAVSAPEPITEPTPEPIPTPVSPYVPPAPMTQKKVSGGKIVAIVIVGALAIGIAGVAVWGYVNGWFPNLVDQISAVAQINTTCKTR